MTTPNTINPPKSGQPVKTYADFFNGLRDQVGQFDRGKGRLSWLQGRALLLARPQCSKRKGQTWKGFLKSIGITESTAKHLRKVAEKISEAESKTLQYSEMLARCYPSYAAQLKKETNGTGARNGKGDPVWTVDQTVKDLSVFHRRLTDRMLALMPDEVPDEGDENRLSDINRLVAQIRGELGKVDKRVTKWRADLNPSKSRTAA